LCHIVRVSPGGPCQHTTGAQISHIIGYSNPLNQAGRRVASGVVSRETSTDRRLVTELLGRVPQGGERRLLRAEGGKIESQPRQFANNLGVFRAQHFHELFLSRLSKREPIKGALPR